MGISPRCVRRRSAYVVQHADRVGQLTDPRSYEPVVQTGSSLLGFCGSRAGNGAGATEPRVRATWRAAIRHNGRVASEGKQIGSRRGPKKKASLQPSLLGLAIGVTLAVIAWGYLVYAAIDFGSTARGGESQAWWFLGIASFGAVACLFIGLMLISRLLRKLGITSAPSSAPVSALTPAAQDEHPVVVPRPQGGHRAAR
jgi:hypothetical protein